MALCFVRLRKLKEAQNRFQAAIIQDNTSDLASFARNYQDIVANKIFLERPIRFTLDLFGGYDTNLVLKPLDSTVASDITNQQTYFFNPSLRVDYVPVLEGPWLFNASYSFGSSFYQNNSTTHDFISNTLYVAPGYNFGLFALNFIGSISNVVLKNPSYDSYLDSYTYGPMVRTVYKENHMFELFAGATKRNYHQPALTPEDERSSDGFDTYLSWTWIFKEDAMLNLKYEYTIDHTDGIWWDNTGNHVTLNFIYPLIPHLKLQLNGDILMQDYTYDNSAFNNTKRKDRTYTVVAGLNYELNRYMSAIAQYSYINGYSNISIYDYDRDIYTVGFELRF